MFERGSTAVVSTSQFPFLVSVKNEGIYTFQEGKWILQYEVPYSLYKLIHVGEYIYGIGEKGLIVRYNPYRQKWTHTFFPTSQRLWDITGDESGRVITHAGSRLYLSTDFGASWTVSKPFQQIELAPMIRSLFLHKDQLYIGTQIHEHSGGLWKYSVRKESLTLLKKEAESMISSIFIDSHQCMYVAKGNVRTKRGSIERKPKGSNRWEGCQQPHVEKAFLDLFTVGTQVYTTSSQDEFGFSRIYEIKRDDFSLSPIETIAGHGLRGAGCNGDLFISSPVESKVIQRNDPSMRFIH